jgi:hypothetical protein
MFYTIMYKKFNLHDSGYRLLGLRIPFETYTLALQSQYNIVESFHLMDTSYIFANFTFTYKVCSTPNIF